MLSSALLPVMPRMPDDMPEPMVAGRDDGDAESSEAASLGNRQSKFAVCGVSVVGAVQRRVDHLVAVLLTTLVGRAAAHGKWRWASRWR